ncbi:hypothetical protein VZT92_022908 [Zoarces viviparus]|uniref:Uncharacterized protein n=1 Tax=Zoarces viviparus TaxID=48416 RepID=A0AAW1E6X5_ZOAVI
MAARFSVQQALDLFLQDEKKEKKRKRRPYEEVDSNLEDVSEQEDNVEENSDYSPSDEDEQAAKQMFMWKNSAICWSSLLHQVAGRMAAQNIIRMTPGPTRLAISHASDICQSSSSTSLQPLKRLSLQHKRTEEKEMQLLPCKGLQNMDNLLQMWETHVQVPHVTFPTTALNAENSL